MDLHHRHHHHHHHRLNETTTTCNASQMRHIALLLVYLLHAFKALDGNNRFSYPPSLVGLQRGLSMNAQWPFSLKPFAAVFRLLGPTKTILPHSPVTSWTDSHNHETIKHPATKGTNHLVTFPLPVTTHLSKA